MVSVDYFTKWAEEIPTYNNNMETTALFFFNHVITMFSFPKELVSNHGKHFKRIFF